MLQAICRRFILLFSFIAGIRRVASSVSRQFDGRKSKKER